MIEFIVARRGVGGDTVLSNTGKCGLTSLMRKMVFEVKSPDCGAQLILQILKRVTAALDVSHILSNAMIAFGLTSDQCYICIGTRVILESRRYSQHHKSIHLFRVDVKNIDKFWRLASDCQPEDYLTADGVLIWHVMCSPPLNLNPLTCRIRLLDWSQSRVSVRAVTPRYIRLSL